MIDAGARVSGALASSVRCTTDRKFAIESLLRNSLPIAVRL